MLIDITRPFLNNMPAWPGSLGFRVHSSSSFARGDLHEGNVVVMDLHAGTHIDAPRHFLEGKKAVDDISLAALNGPCIVVSIEAAVIDALSLKDFDLPKGARILFKTKNSVSESNVFAKDFVGFSLCGAKYLAEKEPLLVGVDGPSVQAFDASDEVHRILLEKEIVLLENLDLTGATEDECYELQCLPLLMPQLEAAPVRALLRSIET